MAVVRSEKPRLRPLGYPLADLGRTLGDYALWRCQGRGETAYATTPEMAYRMWHAKVFRAEAYFGPQAYIGAMSEVAGIKLLPWHRKVLRWLRSPMGAHVIGMACGMGYALCG